jgi:hypothetical protein
MDIGLDNLSTLKEIRKLEMKKDSNYILLIHIHITSNPLLECCKIIDTWSGQVCDDGMLTLK